MKIGTGKLANLAKINRVILLLFVTAGLQNGCAHLQKNPDGDDTSNSTLETKSEAVGQTDEERQNIVLVQNMFTDTAEKLDASKIDHYFSEDFKLVSNDVHWDLNEYKDFHLKSYKEDRKAISIQKPYEIFAKGDRVAARVSITLIDKKNIKKDIQVMLIAQIKKKKIYRLWELTFPHWQ